MIDFRHAADQFVSRYAPCSPGATGPSASTPIVPTLADSLGFFGRLPGVSAVLDSLDTDCRCLLQGCTASSNADALRRFLDRLGGRDVDVTAVDLLDLPAIYARLGWPMPAMHFVRADARNLGMWFSPGSFDLVVQDFLLNCAPPTEAPALLAAARHVLTPSGLLLLSVTDSTCLRGPPTLSAADFEACHGVQWSPVARDLAELVPDERRRVALLRHVAGWMVTGPANQVGTLITAPHGRFEFFVPLARTMAQLAEAGFEVLLGGQEQGRDDNGLDCTRWRCLARAIS